MLRLIGLKLARAVPVMFAVSLATFFILEAVPGDPAAVVAGPNATPEVVEEIHVELGLDRPVVERYLDWLGSALTGDLGRQLVDPRLPVTTLIKSSFPITLQVAVMAVVMALMLSIPTALVSAARPGAPPDRLFSTAAYAVIALPSFLLALLLIFFFVFHHGLAQQILGAVAVAGIAYGAVGVGRRSGEYPPQARARFLARSGGALVAGAAIALAVVYLLPDFPRQGFVRITAEQGLVENLRSAFLPALALAAIEGAVWMRLLRGDLISTLQEDFILAARAKGMPRWRILSLDALRPSSFSLITVLGVSLGRLIGGTIIVEVIFNLRGLGTLMVQSIGAKDVPVVQGGVLLIAVIYVLVNSGIDIAYGYLDPRIRRGRV